jgi:outer membrane protein assembly factor BamA
VRNNGRTYTRNAYSGTPALATIFYGTKFNAYSLNLGWGYDSLNRSIFADRGMRIAESGLAPMPFSDIEFWTASYDGSQLVPLAAPFFTLMFNGEVTPRPGQDHYRATLPEFLRGWSTSRAWLPGKLPRTARYIRQSVWW